MSAELAAQRARAKANIARAKARALGRIGERAEGYAKQGCPADSGELRESIALRVKGDTLTLFAAAKHAAYVEHGTRRRRARPFLRPAVEAHVEEYRRILLEELRR